MEQRKTVEKSPTAQELWEIEEKKIPHLKLARENLQEAHNAAISIVIGTYLPVPQTKPQQLDTAQAVLARLFPEQPALVTVPNCMNALKWAIRPNISPEIGIMVFRSVMQGLQKKNELMAAEVRVAINKDPDLRAYFDHFKQLILPRGEQA